MFADTPLYKIDSANPFLVAGPATAPLLLVFQAAALLDPELEFIKKVLASVGIVDMAEVVFATTESLSVQYSVVKLAKQVQAVQILVFGFTAPQLGLHTNFHAYDPIQLNGKTYLFVDTVSVIQGNDLLKRKLWNALKLVF